MMLIPGQLFVNPLSLGQKIGPENRWAAPAPCYAFLLQDGLPPGEHCPFPASQPRRQGSASLVYKLGVYRAERHRSYSGCLDSGNRKLADRNFS